MQSEIDNETIYEENWEDWIDMKRFGPASRWLRMLVTRALAGVDRSGIDTILDVGCGEGTLSAHLASLFPEAHVKGIDVVESSISIASRAWQSEHLCFEKLPVELEQRKYTLVTAFEVLEHIEDWQSFLTHMTERSERFLLLSFPTGRMRPFEVKMGHYRNYQVGEVETVLDGMGFDPVEVSYSGFPFFSPLYRDVCNVTDSGFNQFTVGKYGFIQKRVSDLLLLSFLASTRRRRGDQFCGLFERKR